MKTIRVFFPAVFFFWAWVFSLFVYIGTSLYDLLRTESSQDGLFIFVILSGAGVLMFNNSAMVFFNKDLEAKVVHAVE